jgi:hypothetical protein
VQYYFGNNAGMNINVNVSVEYSVSGHDNADLQVLVTPVGADAASFDDYEITFAGRCVTARISVAVILVVCYAVPRFAHCVFSSLFHFVSVWVFVGQQGDIRGCAHAYTNAVFF